MPLSGCAAGYKCGGLVPPLDGHTLGPIAKVVLGDGNVELTVGNESLPVRGNTAIIKSLEYGASDGHQVRIEILDEEGGTFIKFFDNLYKCISKSSKVDMKVQFGWTRAGCQGDPSPILSPEIKLIPMSVDVSFSGGIAKYTIIGMDAGQAVFNSREEKSYGSETNKMKLKEAIQQFCNDEEPKFQVVYQRRNADGSISRTWDFQGGEDGQPKQWWQANRQNKLSTIMEWIRPYRTDRDKGVIPCIDNITGNTLILWEDPQPGCDEDVSCNDALSLGTFVVNGGKNSSVIEFSPNIKWYPTWSKLDTGGNSGSSSTGETTVAQRLCDDIQTNTTGTQTSIPVPHHAISHYGKANAHKETQKSGQLHNRAQAMMDGALMPVQGELKIQGNPQASFVDLTQMAGKTVAIVFINPFHIVGDSEFKDWLARPECNQVLSHKRWLVLGINHSIKEGSYVTTIKVSLDAPASGLPEGKPLGGGAGGYMVPNTCST